MLNCWVAAKEPDESKIVIEISPDETLLKIVCALQELVDSDANNSEIEDLTSQLEELCKLYYPKVLGLGHIVI